MEEIVVNELMRDGMRRMRIICDHVDMFPRFYGAVPICARDKVMMDESKDQALGIYSMELTWPVFEPYEFFIHGPRKFRRLMVVNYVYAERVSECIRLGAEAFWCGTHFYPRCAFVGTLPNGAEEGMDIYGVQLFEAEWMPGQCVAIGGRDG